MASWNVIGRTDEMLYDFRLWCSAVASTDGHTLQQISGRLKIHLEDSSLASRQMVAREMLRRMDLIVGGIFSGPPQDAPGNGFPADDLQLQPLVSDSYKEKRSQARKMVFLNRRSLIGVESVSELQLCPSIYARCSSDKWQRTTFRETWKNDDTRLVSGLPYWIANDDHVVVRFLKTESQVFGWAEHLQATNVLYVVAVELRTEGESSDEEKSEAKDGETLQEGERSSNGEMTGLQAAAAGGGGNRHKELHAEEWCRKELEQDSDQDKETNVVHYYVGQTLRDVVRRCEGHCQNAKFLLDEAPKHAMFREFEEAAKVRKVLLVEAYLAAAKATAIARPAAANNGRCAVIVVRRFVDRKAELIRRFRLTDMRRGLNGGKAIQMKITDFFTPEL